MFRLHEVVESPYCCSRDVIFASPELGSQPCENKCFSGGFVRVGRSFLSVMMALLFVAVLFSGGARAQQLETSLPLSQRFTINLAAGVPEYVVDAASTSNAPQSQWWFENTENSATYATTSFVESSDPAWRQVGLPYDSNVPRTFINQDSGGGAGSDTGNNNWYRLHFKVDPKYAGLSESDQPDDEHVKLCSQYGLLLGRCEPFPADAVLHLSGELDSLHNSAGCPPGASLESRLRVHHWHTDS
jgi:hypothetical protein